MHPVIHPMRFLNRFKRAAWIAVTAWTVSATCATAQFGQVVGQVTGPDGLPLDNVEVQAGPASAMTDPGGVYQLDGVAQQSRVVVQFSRDGFATTFGIVDLAPLSTGGDSDGDGIPDAEDACPFSDLSPTVVIDGCDSGVDNILGADGCTISDRIAACADGVRNHGGFVRCVKDLLRDLVDDDVISRKESKRAERCAARANIPPRDDDSHDDDSRDDDSRDDRSNDDCSRDSRSRNDRSKDSRCGAPEPASDWAPVTPAGTIGTPTFATLNKVMVPCGAAQVVGAENGGVVEQDGFRVTFLPGVIDAVGDVEVVLCPIDVSLPEIGAFPGDYFGIGTNGDLVLLETFTLMDVSLSQGGLPISLAAGQEAVLEFPLPETTSLVEGDMIGLWYFNSVTGFWVEEGVGLVGVASFDPARLSVVGTVSHFSWWNCDRPIATFSCIQGVVRDADGNPVPGAQVVASGVDYSGSSYSATDENGAYCMNVRIDSTVEVTASAFAGVVQSASQVVGTGAANVTCAGGGCVQVDLTLPAASCIEGVVVDAGGAPVEGVLVRSTAGTFDTTAADGTFCLAAPADTLVFVLAGGFPVESVLSPGEGPTCDEGGCAAVLIQEPPVSGGTTCISGAFFLDDFNPAGETVLAIEVSSGFPVGTVGVTDDNAAYCIEGVPLNVDVFVEGRGPTCDAAFSGIFNTGSAEGDCEDSPGNCVVAPELNCFGGGEFF